MATNVGRIGLTHPDLGTAGGSALWTQINTIYQTLGDAISGRLFTGTALANGATSTQTHGFNVAFSEVHYRLYAYNHSTGAIGAQITSGWTVAANGTNPTTQVDITNNSGSSADFAIILIHDGNRKLSETQDIDFTTAPQDGQALVYNGSTSKWIAGASGDSSFKLQSIASDVLTLKGGHIVLADDRELATYDGVSTYGGDITVNLLTLLATPVNGTTYYLYIDLDSLGSSVLDESVNRDIYGVTVSNLVLMTTLPKNVNRTRYRAIGLVVGIAGNHYSTSLFKTLATRFGNNAPIAASMIVSRPATGTAVGSVGSSGQIAQGHVLSTKSFPSAAASNTYSFFGLAAGSGTDGSSNGNNLTANASPGSTTGILGAAGEASSLNGTSQYFSSSAAFFNPGNGKSWSVAAWATATNWATGAQTIVDQRSATSDLGFLIQANFSTGGTIDFRATNTASSWDAIISVPQSFANGSWHHVGMSFNFATSTLSAYIDGKLVGTATLANTRSVTSAAFHVGASILSSSFFAGLAGSVDECFFVNNYALTDNDMRRLAAYRYDHNAQVAAKNQRWSAKVYPIADGDAFQPGAGWLVGASDSNSVFWDFSDLGSTDTVDVILEDFGLTPYVQTGVQPYDNIFTSTLPSSVAHGQPDIPEVIVMVEDGTAGEWAPINTEGKVRADATNVYFDTTVLPTPAASPNRVWVIARSKRTGAASVPQATSARLGTVFLGTMTKYNKIVGTGNGAQFSTLSGASLTAGDCVLINSNVAETADLSIPAGVFIDQLPNTVVSLTGALTNGVRFTGAKSSWRNAYVQMNPTGTQAKGISLEANDVQFEGILELNTAQTLTDALNVLSTALRVRAIIDVIKTLGTITNLETNNSTGATRTDVWGG